MTICFLVTEFSTIIAGPLNLLFVVVSTRIFDAIVIAVILVVSLSQFTTFFRGQCLSVDMLLGIAVSLSVAPLSTTITCPPPVFPSIITFLAYDPCTTHQHQNVTSSICFGVILLPSLLILDDKTPWYSGGNFWIATAIFSLLNIGVLN